MLQTHLLVELFSIIVSMLIAIVAWHDYHQSASSDSGLLVGGFVAVALIDLAHALTYDGMPRLIIENSTQRALFFWLAGRSLAAITLLVLALDLRPLFSRLTWLAAGIALAALVFACGTWWIDVIPPLFLPGQGLTTNKLLWEYALVGTDVLIALLFVTRTSSRPQGQLHLFASACLIMAMGELVFTHYKSPSDFLNSFGHAYKIAAYAFLYQALFVYAIRAPYQRLQTSEERFRNLTDLSSDWFWKIDPQLRFTELSPGFSSIADTPQLGLHPWELAPRNGPDSGWEQFRLACSAGLPVRQLRLPFLAAGGDVLWFSLSSSPVMSGETLLGFQGVCTEVTERVRYEYEMERLAFRDAMTGLPNRVMLQERLAIARARLNGDAGRISLLLLNIDNFRAFNELGHAAGDDALRKIALRLSGVVTDPDTLGHLGGDEFVALTLSHEGRNQAQTLASNMLAALRRPIVVEGRECDVTGSIGIAHYPDDGDTFDSLRRCADAAMRQAKAAGKDTFRLHDDSTRREASDRLTLRNSLRRAIDRHEFELYYQPQFDLRSGAIVGAEALIRWNHPERGFLSPFHFIGAAEEFGLIIPIGQWVLHEACRQGAEWAHAGLPPVAIAVNCSALQFKRGSLQEDIVSALHDSGLRPEWLELELTESILAEDADQLHETVRAIKAMGVQLAIDDFGTDYCNFRLLRRLGIGKLKIDQSFVRDILVDENDANIVTTMIQLAAQLGMAAVAEGIEGAPVADRLRDLGCALGQGYHLGHPVPAAVFAELLGATVTRRD
ncbi:MAG: EAL domain-containing protein [Pseudomonadota bacterium]|nr:EAL domain-containing protein [Pseudomonadota bacterium]